VLELFVTFSFKRKSKKKRQKANKTKLLFLYHLATRTLKKYVSRRGLHSSNKHSYATPALKFYSDTLFQQSNVCWLEPGGIINTHYRKLPA